jgi:DNA-binding MarR family transcriptional regulator
VLALDLGWGLGMAFRAYLEAANAAFGDLPGGPRGYQVLVSAARGEPESQRALARRLGIDRTVMTYLLDDLEEGGLVQRRPDPSDRRARRIEVTAEGRALLVVLDRRLGDVERHVLDALREDEQATFRDLLRRIAERADAAEPFTGPADITQEIAGARGASARRSR